MSETGRGIETSRGRRVFSVRRGKRWWGFWARAAAPSFLLSPGTEKGDRARHMPGEARVPVARSVRVCVMCDCAYARNLLAGNGRTCERYTFVAGDAWLRAGDCLSNFSLFRRSTGPNVRIIVGCHCWDRVFMLRSALGLELRSWNCWIGIWIFV